MKNEIQPKWYPDAKVICSCGHSYTIGSTVPELRVEICGHCHPYFTGTEKLIDTERRVEKFEKKRLEAQKAAEARVSQSLKKKETEKIKEEAPKTLKEMLKEAKKRSL